MRYKPFPTPTLEVGHDYWMAEFYTYRNHRIFPIRVLRVGHSSYQWVYIEKDGSLGNKNTTMFTREARRVLASKELAEQYVAQRLRGYVDSAEQALRQRRKYLDAWEGGMADSK